MSTQSKTTNLSSSKLSKSTPKLTKEALSKLIKAKKSPIVDSPNPKKVSTASPQPEQISKPITKRNSTSNVKKTSTKTKLSKKSKTTIPPAPNHVYPGPMVHWTELSGRTRKDIEDDFFNYFKSSQLKTQEDVAPNGVRGLFATQKINPGDIITAIPSYTAITESLARNSIIGKCIQDILIPPLSNQDTQPIQSNKQTKSSNKQNTSSNQQQTNNNQLNSPYKSIFFDEFGSIIITPGHFILFTYLIYLRFTDNPIDITINNDNQEENNNNKNNVNTLSSSHSDNPHRIYARWLPSEYTIPICWSHDLMIQTSFNTTDMYKSTQNRIKHLHIIYHTLFPVLFDRYDIFDPNIFTFERFIWAYCAYTSRSFPAHFLQHYKVVESLYNLNQYVLYPQEYEHIKNSTHDMSNDDDDDNDNNCIILKQSSQQHDISLCGVMLPYMDLTNHTNNHEIHWLCGPHEDTLPTKRIHNIDEIECKNNSSLLPLYTVPSTPDARSHYTVDQLGRIIIGLEDNGGKDLSLCSNTMAEKTTTTTATTKKSNNDKKNSSNNNSTISESSAHSNVNKFNNNHMLSAFMLDKIIIRNNDDERGIHPTIISPNFTHSFFPPSSTNTSPNIIDEGLYHNTFYQHVISSTTQMTQIDKNNKVNKKNKTNTQNHNHSSQQLFYPYTHISPPKILLHQNGTVYNDFISYQACVTYNIGNEVYNNYGPKTQDELLFGYGFILEEFNQIKQQIDNKKNKENGKNHKINQKNTQNVSISELNFSPNNAVFVQLPKPSLNNPIAQQELMYYHIMDIASLLNQDTIQYKNFMSNPFLYELTSNGLPQGIVTMMALMSITNVDLDTLMIKLNQVVMNKQITHSQQNTQTPPTNNTITSLLSPHLRQRGLFFLLQQLLNKLFTANPLINNLNNPIIFTKMTQIVDNFVPNHIIDPFSSSKLSFPLFSSILPQLYHRYRVLTLYFMVKLVYFCPFALPSCHNSTFTIPVIDQIALVAGLGKAIEMENNGFGKDGGSNQQRTTTTTTQKKNQNNNKNDEPKIEIEMLEWGYSHYCAIIHLITQNHIRFIAIEHCLSLLQHSIINDQNQPSLSHLQQSHHIHPAFNHWSKTIPTIENNQNVQQILEYNRSNTSNSRDTSLHFEPIICNMFYSSNGLWFPSTKTLSNTQKELNTTSNINISIKTLDNTVNTMLYIPQSYLLSITHSSNLTLEVYNNDKHHNYNNNPRHFPPINAVAKAIRYYSQQIFGGVDFYIEMALFLLFIRNLCSHINFSLKNQLFDDNNNNNDHMKNTPSDTDQCCYMTLINQLSQLPLSQYEMGIYLTWNQIITQHFKTPSQYQLDDYFSNSLNFGPIETNVNSNNNDYFTIPHYTLQPYQYLNSGSITHQAYSTCYCNNHGGVEFENQNTTNINVKMDNSNETTPQFAYAPAPTPLSCTNCKQCCKNSPVIGNSVINGENDIIVMAQDMIFKTILAISSHFDPKTTHKSFNSIPPLDINPNDSNYTNLSLFGEDVKDQNDEQNDNKSNYPKDQWSYFYDDLSTAFHLIHQLKTGSGVDLKLIPLPFPLTPQQYNLDITTNLNINDKVDNNDNHINDNDHVLNEPSTHKAFSLIQSSGYSVFVPVNVDKTMSSCDSSIVVSLDTPMETFSQHIVAKEDTSIIDSSTYSIPNNTLSLHTSLNNNNNNTSNNGLICQKELKLTIKQQENINFFSLWLEKYALYHEEIRVHNKNSTTMINSKSDIDLDVKLTHYLDGLTGQMSDIDCNNANNSDKTKSTDEEPLLLSAPRIGDPSDITLRFDLGLYIDKITKSINNIKNLKDKKTLNHTVSIQCDKTNSTNIISNNRNNNIQIGLCNNSIKISIQTNYKDCSNKYDNVELTIPYIPTQTYSLCTKWFIKTLLSLAKPSTQNKSIHNDNAYGAEHDDDDDDQVPNCTILPSYITEWLGGYDLETVLNTIFTSTDLFSQPFLSVPVLQSHISNNNNNISNIDSERKNNFSKTGNNNHNNNNPTKLLPDHIIAICLNLLRLSAHIVDKEDDSTIDFGFDFGDDDDDNKDQDDMGEMANNNKNKNNNNDNDNINFVNKLFSSSSQFHHYNLNTVLNSTEGAFINKCLPAYPTKGDTLSLLNRFNISQDEILNIFNTISTIHSTIDSIIFKQKSTTVNNINTNYSHNQDKIDLMRQIESIRWGTIIKIILTKKLSLHISVFITLLLQWNNINSFVSGLDDKNNVQAIFENFFSHRNDNDHMNGALKDELTPSIIYHVMSISNLYAILQE